MEPIRKFDTKEIAGLIQDLEFIRVNLARIARLPARSDDELKKMLFIKNLFLNDAQVITKFTRVWQTLIGNYTEDERDELDDLLGIIEHWQIPVQLSDEELLMRLKEAPEH